MEEECLSRYGQGQKATWGAKVGGATRRSTCASCAPSAQQIQVLLLTEQGVCCDGRWRSGWHQGVELSLFTSFFSKRKKKLSTGKKNSLKEMWWKTKR